jgi:hypothetical protein
MFQITQWTQGWGRGASGSSQISANDLVSSGAPDHASGGETFFPSPVYFTGIRVPWSKTPLVIVMVAVLVVIGESP